MSEGGHTGSAQERTQYAHSDLTRKIIGCAMTVHRALGPGFPEAVYHKALCLELVKQRIPFESEKAFEVRYDATAVGQFRADFLIDGKVILELRALSELNGQHVAQALSYLKASGLNVALLLNFGTKSMQTKRVVL